MSLFLSCVSASDLFSFDREGGRVALREGRMNMRNSKKRNRSHTQTPDKNKTCVTVDRKRAVA